MKQFEFNYVGQIRAARRFVINNNIAKAEDVAMMTDSDLAHLIAKYADENDYDVVVADEGQSIGLIPNGAIWFER